MTDRGLQLNKWLRRIRGAIGMGLTWALAWFIAGLALLLIVGPDAADVPFPLGFGLLGFLSGVTFSGTLGLFDGRRRFEDMSPRRFALWGAVGATALATVFVLLTGVGIQAMLFLGPIFALAGATSAAGALAIAQTAANPASQIALGRANEIGPTHDETRDISGG